MTSREGKSCGSLTIIASGRESAGFGDETPNVSFFRAALGGNQLGPGGWRKTTPETTGKAVATPGSEITLAVS